jgi:hypothetical protein
MKNGMTSESTVGDGIFHMNNRISDPILRYRQSVGDSLRSFKGGATPILVATGVAARGL